MLYVQCAINSGTQFNRQFHRGGLGFASFLLGAAAAGDIITAYPQDSNNLRLDRSLATQDISQRLVISAVYNLPFGPGKQWLGSSHGLVGKLVENWRMSGIGTLQTGGPLALTNSVNNINNFSEVSRPNNNGQSGKLAQETPGEWFNINDFTLPAPYTYGTTGRTLPNVRTDGVTNIDFSLMKGIPIKEGLAAEFRVEVFNLPNTPQFGVPAMVLGVSTFGVVSTQANPPREVQLALRLRF